MSDSTEDIITASIREAEGGDPVESPDVDPDPEVVEDPVTPETPDTPELEKAEVVVPEVDDDTKELEALGLKAPKEGERENRLPYSRVKKILANARKKLSDSHAETLKTQKAELDKALEKSKNMDAVDALIRTDPARYLGMLANLHPTLYKKYVDMKEAAVEEKKPAAHATEPPPPDWKFEDGSLGYSPEQQKKLLEWQALEVERRTTEKVTAAFDKRLAPIEQERRTAATIAQKLPVVRAQIADAKATWGELFTKNEAEVLKALQDNPLVPFDAVVSKILFPKAQANRDTMRAELMKEAQGRKTAARVAPGSTAAVAPKKDDGPKTTEEIIMASIAALKR